jgi:hypothetical protein
LDERELAELFRETARAIPPAPFEARDVRRAAHQATVRRRLGLIVGGVVAVVLVAGAAEITGLFRGPAGPEALAPSSGPADTSPEHAAESGTGVGTLLQPAGPCGPPDTELASALAIQLPEAAGLNSVPARGNCPPGSRGAAFLLRGGSLAGEVTVVLSPGDQRPVAGADAARQVTRRTRGGWLITVRSDPRSPAVPDIVRLGKIATTLASRF